MNQEKVKKMMPIYLDYHSTTPMDVRVFEAMSPFMHTYFGNASSMDHPYGAHAQLAVAQATNEVAKLVGSLPEEVIFTSGATESINIVLQGMPKTKSRKIAVLPLEHKAVLDTCLFLENNDEAEIIYLRVDDKGRIDLNEIENLCENGLSLLCVMMANNEIGTIYPIKEISQITSRYSVPFLCDATQGAGKIPIDMKELGITFLALSAHKMYGPKGVGALVVREGFPLNPLIIGGRQQNGLRSGTLNVPGIVGLGEACRLRNLEMKVDEAEISIKRDTMQTLLKREIPDLKVNGDIQNRLSGNLHFSIPYIKNSDLISAIRSQVAISSGSACSSGGNSKSHVLENIGLLAPYINGAIRIGIGKFTTAEDITKAAKIIIEAVLNLRDR
jgi:cysteine desulfurase